MLTKIGLNLSKQELECADEVIIRVSNVSRKKVEEMKSEIPCTKKKLK